MTKQEAREILLNLRVDYNTRFDPKLLREAIDVILEPEKDIRLNIIEAVLDGDKYDALHYASEWMQQNAN